MTNAAIPVTQSAVERFSERYLRSVGCTVEKEGDQWEVTVPSSADTELAMGTLSIRCGDEPQEEDVVPLHPESAFFQRILSEASTRCSSGKLSVNTEDTQVEIPPWLEGNDIKVKTLQFTPYYDRTAVLILFRVGIETVSEYQKELLRAIAIDVRSEECLPKLEETFLRMTSLAEEAPTRTQIELDKGSVRPLLDTARSHLVGRIQRQIDETHQEASRAADAEVEEYRQMQQQRIQELEEKHSTLSSKIDELSQTVNSGDQKERVRALKERKELKSQYDEVGAELNELRERRDQGFPERQREIRDRHALDVQISALTVTEVEYERGEATFELTESDNSRTLTTGYGSGVGVTETVHCTSCGGELSDQNPLSSIRDGLRCEDCAH